MLHDTASSLFKINALYNRLQTSKFPYDTFYLLVCIGNFTNRGVARPKRVGGGGGGGGGGGYNRPAIWGHGPLEYFSILRILFHAV
jgi:hypothetical protein